MLQKLTPAPIVTPNIAKFIDSYSAPVFQKLTPAPIVTPNVVKFIDSCSC